MSDRDRRSYCVYILANRSKTLYVGVTGNLHQRIWQPNMVGDRISVGATNLDRLVYYESFDEVIKAINREKKIKGLLRIKKIELIVSMNPMWRDLSEEWYTRHRYQPEKCIDPSLCSG